MADSLEIPVGELSWDTLHDEYERVWRLWRQERTTRIEVEAELKVALLVLARIPSDVVRRAFNDEYAVVSERNA